METPILWQNSDRTVTLIDIPRSISAAQTDGTGYSTRTLLSTPPLQSPFPSNEPKSASAKAKLKTTTAEDELHTRYEHLLQQASYEVQTSYNGEWCLPRTYVERSTLPVKKRRLDQIDVTIAPTERPDLPERFCSYIAHRSPDDAITYSISWPPDEDDGRETSDTTIMSRVGAGLSLCNHHQEAARLTINAEHAADGVSFRIPPSSSFYLGDCAESKPFRDTVRKQATQTSSQATFDFILLDPPWPNRSIKRTHKTPGSTYATSPSVEDIRDLILSTHLDMLMADESLVAVWITNKPSIRDLVLGENGIFECWGVELMEEWIWLKTTLYGEPVTPLDGVWRKPYEVLLVGQKTGNKSPSARPPALQHVKHRVIIGVPDMHSRKPCLKTVIEPMMSEPADYKALEVFARHLVAGWCSWGDECMKFNWEGYWRHDDDD